MTSPTILNYQGNKSSLIPFIKSNLKKYINEGEVVCDIFSGSGSVANSFKNDQIVISNDAELYSSIINSALLNTPSKSTLSSLKQTFKTQFDLLLNKHFILNESAISKERYLLENNNNIDLIKFYSSFPTIWNEINPDIKPEILRKNARYNLFLYYYSGSYFSIEQSIHIDTIVQTIHSINKKINVDVLYSCLFFAMKECVFSKDGHMAQPLNPEKNSTRHFKQRKKSISDLFYKKLEEFIIYADDIDHNEHTILNQDLSEILENDVLVKRNVKLVYADPPYTDMQYSRYYHLLNVAAKYEYPKPTIFQSNYTIGLYTDGRNQSDLSKKSSAKRKLNELFKYCKKNNIILALSYAYPKDIDVQKTDRYTVSIQELIEIAKATYGSNSVQVAETDYTHANHRNSNTKKVIEYLIICGRANYSNKNRLFELKKDIKNIKPSSKNPIYNTHLYWSQKSFNIIDSIINKLTVEGDIIFDPFMGSGVTILESIKDDSSRRAIGCDVNEMPQFIIDNLINHIPNSDLNEIFDSFQKKLNELQSYYKTECSNCNSNGQITKVIFDKQNRNINNYIIKTVNYNCSNCGKMVKLPDENDYKNILEYRCDSYIPNLKLIPNSKIAVGKSDFIKDIFTPRNFSVLNEIVHYIDNSNNKEVLNYILMSVIHLSKITDTHSNSQWPLWIPKINCVEKNIIDLLTKRLKNIQKAKEFITKNFSKSKIVNSFNDLTPNSAYVLTKGSQHITETEIPNDSISLIITDPPYMDQVLYSEYMQLYKPFIGLKFNIEDEIIVSTAEERKRNKEEYFRLLNQVFEMSSNKLKENSLMCLFFHDSNLSVWVDLIKALEKNGFRFISQEHIKKGKTIKNILSPKKSLSGDAILFFENTRTSFAPKITSLTSEEIAYNIYLEARKLLEQFGDLSTPELYDLGLMEILIENGWLNKLSEKYKSLVEIFEEHFLWKKEIGKWHL